MIYIDFVENCCYQMSDTRGDIPMKEVKFYCDFCGNEIGEIHADGNFRDDNRTRVEVTTKYGGNPKHTCIGCLILLIQKKETDIMMRKVQNRAPLPARITKKDDSKMLLGIDADLDENGYDDLPSAQRGEYR